MKKRKIFICIIFCLLMTLSPFINAEASSSVKLNKTSITVEVGKTYNLKVKGTTSKVKWKTANKKVAAVDSKGKVTGNKAGKTTITATVGKKTLKCKVTVKAVKLNKTSITVGVGKTYNLKVKGTTGKVKWKTANKKVATVNSKGKVTGKKAGKTTITATVGKQTLKCKVTVKSNKILFVNKSSIQIMDKGTVTITFKADGEIYYDISDPDIVSCEWAEDWDKDKIKLNITGKKNGVASITITNSVNKEKVKIKVTVKGLQKIEEYGNVSGNVSFYYNQFIGHRADTGAKIFLIPKDGSALKAESIYSSPYIYTASVDFTGNYILQHIPVGEYRMLMVSRETTEGAWFNAASQETYYDDISQYFYPNYMTQEMATVMVSHFVSMYKWYVEDVTVRKDESTVVSHDFGTTYI